MNAVSGRGRRAAGPAGTLTRRQVAAQLSVHADSVSRLLHSGLACAVATWGGNGKEMTFEPRMVARWRRARACSRRAAGDVCMACSTAVEDCQLLAEHLLDERHGIGGCSECRAPWLTSSWRCVTTEQWLRGEC